MKTVIDEVRKLLDRMPKETTFENIEYHVYMRQRVQLSRRLTL